MNPMVGYAQTQGSLKSKNESLEQIGAVAGVLSILFYFAAAVLPFIPDAVSRLLGFSFPLLWILSFLGIYLFLKRENDTATLQLAYIFGIIGATLACSFIVIQQANILWHREAMALADTETAKSLLKATFQSANRVQGALDVVFDIFITISWILFGINIARNSNFNKIFGWLGALIGLGLLVLNLYTFPNPPATAGLFDLGPFLALWSLVFYIWFALIVFKK